ncbi:MAG TPA: BamA/TamA family outer membrane protein [Draconibacterium sp.]|nr:BamA/TamA family outer membrane protein [Draconibacterium sp.]
MRIHQNILLIVAVLVVLLINSCSNTKFMTGDQILYNGRKVEIISNEKSKTVKKAEEIAGVVSYAEPNNSLMGRRILPPVGLWYYTYKKPEEGKRGGFFYRTLNENPVLISEINPDLRIQKIESDLFANGFFNTNASYTLDTAKNNPRKARILYSVKVEQPYRLAQILNQPALDSIDTLINSYSPNLNLKTGDIFNLETIRNEKRKLASMLVEEGYYFFSPNEIEIVADTSQTPFTINLLVRKKPLIAPYIAKKYTINRVEVNVKRTNTDEPEPTEPDTILYDGVYITGQTDYLKPEVLTRSTLFREGDLYSETKHRGTIPLLNNYGVFQSVKMQFDVTDSVKQKMNVLLDLQPKNDVTLNLEGAVQSKSTGFAGPASEITLAHANLFKGANRLQVKAFGGFEWQWGKESEEDLSSNSYNAGINSSISFPKMIVPFKSVKENKSIIGKTIGSLGFEFVNNVKYYRMNSLNMAFGYQWRKTQKVTHSFNPFKMNMVSLLKTTALFDSIVEANPYVKRSFEEQYIIGTEYSFTYDNSALTRDGFYFQGMISTSGNLIDAFMQIGGEERPYTIFGDIYSQFVKTSVDVRYYTNTTKEGLVLRLYAGTGISYGNSSVMPYVEQYFSGGSNSLRGFTARSLGPGSYKPEEYNGIVDQTGDIKLEFNSEYRFRMSEIMLGALFLEAGNVWLLNPDENRPGSQFKFSNFTEQLAVGTGVGVRFDFDFFILRTDFGLPLRFPYNDGDGNWNHFSEVFEKFRFNLAIGYPF